MALNKKKSSKSKNESRYIKVANIWPSKDHEDQVYIQTDDYFGELLFREKDTGNLYKIDFMNLFEPKTYKNKQGKTIKPPKNLLFNVCVNPANENALTKTTLDELESGESDEADQDDDDSDEYQNSPSKRSSSDDSEYDSESDSEESSEDEQE